MNQRVPRHVIGGVHTLLFPDGPYVEVAERVRIVHKMGWSFCVHRVEALLIQKHWIYRTWITVDDRQYIGDAEIHFSAPKETPDGTNPVSCGQTSAIGNALTFAGFGDLRLLTERLDQGTEAVLQEYPSEPPYGTIEGIRVVWLENTPYVAVAERLYCLHRLGHALSMERCEIIEINGVWVYRVFATVNGQRYIGDAEIHFEAPETVVDSRYPISTAQTSAVGNALALAGFGDVRSILERSGKDASSVEGKPALASADAVLRASRLRPSSQEQQPSSPSENAHGSQETPTLPQQHSVTARQQDTIHGLCERLGESEPDYTSMTFETAEQCIRQLQASEEELLQIVDEATRQEHGSDMAPTPKTTPVQGAEIVGRQEVDDLKHAWLEAFQIKGTRAEKREQWHRFKLTEWGSEVDDTTMLRAQYAQLTAAIQTQKEQETDNRTAKTHAGANGY